MQNEINYADRCAVCFKALRTSLENVRSIKAAVYLEALQTSLENVRSIKAANPGVRVYDEWEKYLSKIIAGE